MPSVVVDANTIVKWFVVEEFSAEARRVLRKSADLVAPDFMPAEVMSTMLRKLRKGQIDEADVFIARNGIRDAFELVPSEPLLDAALRLAVPNQQSAYDSTYVIVARQLGCQFVTADRRLYNAIAPIHAETMLWIENVPA
jgi:predicted nucleic acid-binding protein